MAEKTTVKSIASSREAAEVRGASEASLNLPSFEQIVNLALKQVGITLESMKDVVRVDKKWGHDDLDISTDYAIDFVRDAIASMVANPSTTYETFYGQWNKVDGAVRVARRAFQREGYYKDLLETLHREVGFFFEAVEIATPPAEPGGVDHA